MKNPDKEDLATAAQELARLVAVKRDFVDQWSRTYPRLAARTFGEAAALERVIAWLAGGAI